MFVPIDRLPPILGDLIADGRVSPARASLARRRGRRVARPSRGRRASRPAARPRRPASASGDEIVGVAGEAPRGLADFYRKIWATGAAGATVPLDVEQGGEKRRIDVKSINRLDNLKLKSTL